MTQITVQERTGILCLSLGAPLPRSCEGWESLVSGVHHACLGRAATEDLLIDLRGIHRLTSSDLGGIVRCIATVVKARETACRIRVVTDSVHVRRTFRMFSTAQLTAHSTPEEALASVHVMR